MQDLRECTFSYEPQLPQHRLELGEVVKKKTVEIEIFILFFGQVEESHGQSGPDATDFAFEEITISCMSVLVLYQCKQNEGRI